MATNKQIDQYFAGQTEPVQQQMNDAQNNYAEAKAKLNGIAEQGKNDLNASFNRYSNGLVGNMRNAGNHTGMVDSAKAVVRNGYGAGIGAINKQNASDNADVDVASGNQNRTLQAELDRYAALAEAEKLKRRTGKGSSATVESNLTGDPYNDYIAYGGLTYDRAGDQNARTPSRIVADDRYFLGDLASNTTKNRAKEYQDAAKAQYKTYTEAEKERKEKEEARAKAARGGSGMNI